MIPFSPIKDREVSQRVQDVVRAAFALCQSAADVATAVRAIFSPATDGTTTLTLGTTAPDVLSTTPTYYEWTAPDGTVNITPGWRVR